jgi:hypothetical protein
MSRLVANSSASTRVTSCGEHRLILLTDGSSLVLQAAEPDNRYRTLAPDCISQRNMRTQWTGVRKGLRGTSPVVSDPPSTHQIAGRDSRYRTLAPDCISQRNTQTQWTGARTGLGETSPVVSGPPSIHQIAGRDSGYRPLVLDYILRKSTRLQSTDVQGPTR